MTDPLPKNWKRGETRYRLLMLASLVPGNQSLYIMENLQSGMNDAIAFDDPELEVIQKQKPKHDCNGRWYCGNPACDKEPY